eukprot:CAMPEP_0174276160 /NCGR_PEP_ID=MMETSP0439-20130205/60230_1 /TAXON_ID=0 /ORGANISM="Stereomyxa ramosa, Strain Chinc5" /LENGTH=309 /DNA_ID=CAMNT_0015368353 /DNA_START=961 /DNA_END=1890 /DNA_ORIENTATION=+
MAGEKWVISATPLYNKTDCTFKLPDEIKYSEGGGMVCSKEDMVCSFDRKEDLILAIRSDSKPGELKVDYSCSHEAFSDTGTLHTTVDTHYELQLGTVAINQKSGKVSLDFVVKNVGPSDALDVSLTIQFAADSNGTKDYKVASIENKECYENHDKSAFVCHHSFLGAGPQNSDLKSDYRIQGSFESSNKEAGTPTFKVCWTGTGSEVCLPISPQSDTPPLTTSPPTTDSPHSDSDNSQPSDDPHDSDDPIAISTTTMVLTFLFVTLIAVIVGGTLWCSGRGKRSVDLSNFLGMSAANPSNRFTEMESFS